MHFVGIEDLLALSVISGLTGILFSFVLAKWLVVPRFAKMRQRLLTYELVKTSQYHVERGLTSRALTHEEANAWVKTLTPPMQNHFLQNPMMAFPFHVEPVALSAQALEAFVPHEEQRTDV